MAIALIGTESHNSGANVTTRTGNLTIAAGSDRILIMFVSIGLDPPNDYGTPTPTWAGQNFVTPIKVDANEGVFCRAMIYYMLEAAIAASSGTAWSVTSGQPADMGVGLQMFSGVDQTTPFGTGATGTGASGTTASATVGSAAGELVIACVASDDDTTLAISGGTTIYQVNGIDGDTAVAAGYWTGAAPNVSAAWTQSSNRWAVAGISLKPAAGGGGRASKNTRAWGLGMEYGMDLWGEV